MSHDLPFRFEDVRKIYGRIYIFRTGEIQIIHMWKTIKRQYIQIQFYTNLSAVCMRVLVMFIYSEAHNKRNVLDTYQKVIVCV